MDASFFIPESILPVSLLPPAAGSSRTSSYFSLKGAAMAYIVFHVDQANAATIALTPKQATAVAGTGTKVLSTNCQIFTNLDCAAASLFTRQTDAANYTTDAGVKKKIVIFKIDPNTLDVANGFDCIALTEGASNAANITSAALYVVMKSQSLTKIIDPISD